MTGANRRASAVMVPCTSATGIAENRQPRPSEAAITQTMSASSAPLSARVDQSPSRPSWIEPTIAIAPMQTVSVAVTKPSTNEASPWLPVVRLSHSPSVTNRASMSSTAPTAVPSAREATIMAVPPAVSEPSWMESIFSSAPARPTNSTHRPVDLRTAFCTRPGMKRPPRRPTAPPPTMQQTLMSVPRPIMKAGFPSPSGRDNRRNRFKKPYGNKSCLGCCARRCPHAAPRLRACPGIADKRGPYGRNQTAQRGIRGVPARRIAQRGHGRDDLVSRERGRDPSGPARASRRAHARDRSGQPDRPCRRRRSSGRPRDEPHAPKPLSGAASRRGGHVLPARAAGRDPFGAAQEPRQEDHPADGLGRREPRRARGARGRSRAVLPHRPHRNLRGLGRHGGLQRLRRAQLRLRPRARAHQRPARGAGRRRRGRAAPRRGRGCWAPPCSHHRERTRTRARPARLSNAANQKRLGLLHRGQHGRRGPVHRQRRHPGHHQRARARPRTLAAGNLGRQLLL